MINQGLVSGGETSNNQVYLPNWGGTYTYVNSRGEVQTTTTLSNRNVNLEDQGEREDFKHQIQDGSAFS